MITFYLVRHGQKDTTMPDPALTDIGVHQANLTADTMSSIEVDQIISSPKLRARQTAQVLAMPHNLTVKVDERLDDETLNRTDGTKFKELLDEIINDYKEGNFIIITQGGPIGDVIRNLFSEDAVEHKQDPSTGVRYIDIPECSITTINYSESKFYLVKVSDCAHLS